MRIAFDPARAASLNLGDLDLGKLDGVDARFGGACAGAAAVCFEQANHAQGVEMVVDGACRASLSVTWPTASNPDQARRTWNDVDEAAEHGAYGVAALLVEGLTEYTVWERAKKGKGYDFWLRPKGNQGGMLLQGAARMEVSGIGPRSSSSLASRVIRKSRQMEPSDAPTLPGVVVVVDFRLPLTRLKCK
jgi:hypothetical protein